MAANQPTADVTEAELNGSSSASGTSVESVMSAIRDHIRRQQLLPGEQIRQTDWADRVGVSRVPVREALTSLALAGVLTHDPHRGFFLNKYSQAEIAQIYFVRSVIEVECARTLRWPSAEEMSQLKQLVAVMNEVADARNAVRWLEAHDTFHSLLLGLSTMTVLAEEAKRLYARTESFRSMRAHNALGHGEIERMSHVQIIEALENHDREGVVEHFARELRVKESDLRQWAEKELAAAAVQ